MYRDLIGNLAWGGGIVVLALVASEARRQGLIDHETTIRLVLGMTGLMIVWTGNRLPKTFVAGAGARRARRVAAWSLVLSGLVYAGFLAFAPIPLALAVGGGAVITGIAVTFGYCLSLRDGAKAG